MLLVYVVQGIPGIVGTAEGKDFIPALLTARKEFVTFMERAKAAECDKRLVEMFQESINAVDRVFRFLEDVGQIERGFTDRAGRESAANAFNAGYLGGSAYADGAGGGESVLAAGLAYFLSEALSGAERDRAKEEATRRAVKALTRSLEGSDAKVKVLLTSLAEKRRWTREVIGGANADPEQLKKALDRDDPGALLKLAERNSRNQPFNPFARALLLSVRSLDDKAAPRELFTLGKQYLLTVKLLPENIVYDPLKAEIVSAAADIIDRGLDRLAARSGRVDPALLDACQAYWVLARKLGGDRDGSVRERMMWQLTKHGSLEEADAVYASIGKLRETSWEFHYYSACLHTRRAKYDLALGHLEKVILILRPVRIGLLRDDPTFSDLPGPWAFKFQELFRPRFEWGIRYGLINDDIWIKNVSAFPITDVELTPVITSGGKEYRKALKVTVVEPGQSHTWSDVFSIPGSRCEKAVAGFRCEQQR